MQLIDTHCHLQSSILKKSVADVIVRAQNAGISHIVSCATNPHDWNAVAELAAKYPMIIPAYGVHPWFLKDLTATWQKDLEALLINTPYAIVGECGLDHMVTERSDEQQYAVLKDHLLLANKLRRPISIHCRKAWQSLIKLLKEVPHEAAHIIIHSYSGSAELVPILSELGCNFSFSGAITQPANKKGHTALSVVPTEKLLIESDSPDMLPIGLVNRPNEPETLPITLKKIAEIRKVSTLEIAEATTLNAKKIFVCS